MNIENRIYTHEFTSGDLTPKEKNEVILNMAGLADYVVFKDKSLKVLDSSIVNRYIDKMTEYDLCCMFYAFNNSTNMVLDSMVNYAMELTMSDTKKEYFVRFPTFDYVVIDIRKTVPKFREDLAILDFNIWLQDCVTQGMLPFNGIYFELGSSELAFAKNSSRLKIEDSAIKNEDMKKIKESGATLKFDNNADDVFNYLRNKNKGV
jgi:hypothetical protein